MKNYAWIIMMAGLLTIPSCSSDSPEVNTPTENEKPAEKDETFSSVTVTIPDIMNMSRVQMNTGTSNGADASIHWAKGDQICMYGQKKYILDIDPAYDETKNGGQRTAKFSTTEKMSPNVYLTVFPVDTPISGDTVKYNNSLEAVDFTSAKTPEEKAKVWKKHMDKNFLFHAEGRLNGGEMEIELLSSTVVASFTYTNRTGVERGIDALEVVGADFGEVWIRRSNWDNLYGWALDNGRKFLGTKGLTLADGESMYFYFHKHSSQSGPIFFLEVEYADGSPVNNIYKERKVWTMITDFFSDVFLPSKGKAGEHYHVDIIETSHGLFWDVPDSGIPVTFENKGLSQELWNMLGETMVHLNDEGHAVIDERDVQGLNEVNLYPDTPDEITSLAGIEKMQNLWYLTCAGTDVASVDLSHNSKLATVFLCDNALTELDVSMLSDLQQLYCGNQRNNITLKLKLSEAQKEKWNNEWSKEAVNQNVILVD